MITSEQLKTYLSLHIEIEKYIILISDLLNNIDYKYYTKYEYLDYIYIDITQITVNYSDRDRDTTSISFPSEYLTKTLDEIEIIETDLMNKCIAKKIADKEKEDLEKEMKIANNKEKQALKELAEYERLKKKFEK